MKRFLSGVGFLSVALVAHLGAAMALMNQDEEASASGSGGEDILSLEAANVAVAAMVEQWETPPEVPQNLPETRDIIAPSVSDMVMPEMPKLDIAPQAQPVPMALTQPMQSPDFEEPEPPKAPPVKQPPKPAPKPEPKPKPTPTAKRQEPSQARQAVAGSTHSSQQQRAAGSGGGAQAGIAQGNSGASLSKSAMQSALRSWGASVRAQVERRKRAIREVGSVKLGLTLSRSGALLGVSVIQSSGNATVDQAALRAVKSVRRYPAAPKGVNKERNRFIFTMRFTR